MAGYAGYSKSNNAIAAEAEGRFPASVLARKLGVKTGAIKALMSPGEWHHTSKRYNVTDYYDGATLLAIASGDEGEIAAVMDDQGLIEEDMDDARALLAALKAWRKPVPTCWVCGAVQHPAGDICPEVLKAREANRNAR